MFNTAAFVCNLIPLAGVTWFGWHPIDLLALYWMESCIAAAFSLPVFTIASRHGATKIAREEVEKLLKTFVGGNALLGIFIFIFPVLFFRIPPDFWAKPHMILGALSLIAERAVALFEDVRYARKQPDAAAELMKDSLFKRQFALQFGLILAVFGLDLLGSASVGILIMVVIKIAFEISAHRRSANARPAAEG